MYDFDDDLDREIVVFCRSGVRSAAAQAMLKQAGFTSVLNLSGGFWRGWNNWAAGEQTIGRS